MARPPEVVEKVRQARWGDEPGTYSDGRHWKRSRESEAQARVVTLPSTPAHVAYAVEPTWAFPHWVQYLNERVTEFLLRPGYGFMAIEASVRHGKSWHISKFTPAWYLGLHPSHHWLHVSYSKDFARRWGTEVRDIHRTHGERLFGSRVARGYELAQDWRILYRPELHADSVPSPERLYLPDLTEGWTLGGGMRSVPRGGQITGGDAHVICLDDPIKDEQEADSKSARNALWGFYQRRLRPRLEPNGKILLVMSRWNTDDIVGRLFDKMEEDEDADQWERIHLKAIAEPRRDEMEQARRELADDAAIEAWLEQWRDELGRKAGEALWEERYPRAALLQTKASVGSRAWSSNFQQEPKDAEGDKFPKDAWRFAVPYGATMAPVEVLRVPKRADLEFVRRFDLAASTKASGDRTATALLAMDRQGRTYVLDVEADRMTADKKKSWAAQKLLADEARWGTGRVDNVLEQEPGSAGKDVADEWVAEVFAGHKGRAETTGADKVLLAEPFSSQVLDNNVYIVMRQREDGTWTMPTWYADFVDEAEEFPGGTHDDEIDAASKAYLDLVKKWAVRRKSKGKVTTAADVHIGR